MALERLTDNLQDMADRAKDMRPAGGAVHAELLQWQRGVKIAQENNLGPSLQNPFDPEHIWDPGPHRFVFGTRVPYSKIHADWRERNGKASHMDLPRVVLRDIARKLGRYVLTGGT